MNIFQKKRRQLHDRQGTREMGITRPLFASVLIVAILDPVQSQLFESDTIREHDKSALICNLQKVAPKAPVLAVTQLEVYKKGANDTKFIELIRFSHVVATGKGIQKFASLITSSKGRITATADGMFVNGSVVNNADTMKVELTINNAICDDAGVYRCKAAFQDLSGKGLNKEVENSLKVTGQTIREITGHISHDRNKFHGDENVTFVCRVDGRPNVSLSWRFQECTPTATPNPSLQDWTNTSHILEYNQGTIQSGGCTYTRLVSKLMNVKLSNGTRKICLIQCVAEINGQLQQWNMTIDYDKPESSASPSVKGTLFGPVMFILGLVVVGVGLVVVCPAAIAPRTLTWREWLSELF